MDKNIIVINGTGGSGKDTFVEYVSKYAKVYNFSSVDKVKEIAKLIGWTGTKTDKDRKFLSDLKAGDRDIFVRRYWYMDNIKDIAKRHGCSETKIKSSLFRSRNKLWEEVKEII